MSTHAGFDYAALTDAGRVRDHNEDAVAVMPACGLVVLADGMGGYAAGEVAGDIAVSVIADVVEQHFLHKPLVPDELWQVLVDAVLEANTAIIAAAIDEPAYRGMGATLVTGLFHQERLIVAHAGDSRAYRLRDGLLGLITRDHSVLQERIDGGLLTVEEARGSSIRNLVTRALGVEPELAVEVHEHAVERGDVYLFCSDGLNDMLADEEIARILLQTGGTLAEAGAALIDAANAAGGADNVSVALVGINDLLS
ncbi:protein phosphatase 2C domain-containing protein|uniref:PP2C family protein-serine/threonine phosphatase n=1 Tax=Noviherbaspirillum sp. L7-7A TaxID=2850560 RepID=UPI001C2C78F9|nr:protein phosphatase 2C domain-containing protein [Noviherbaspirillum sp. L7-7A]MBV0879881.1 protein phosphatase 2C domain-containing protein [Noviherbaspirillum sp. L7-7A]